MTEAAASELRSLIIGQEDMCVCFLCVCVDAHNFPLVPFQFAIRNTSIMGFQLYDV